jgi:hypothetical protein
MQPMCRGSLRALLASSAVTKAVAVGLAALIQIAFALV